MRGATECAKRLKLLVSSLRSKLGKVGQPPFADPVTQMLLGVLSRDTPEAKAGEGLDRLRSIVVDYNELRVIPPIELAETLGDFPDARLKCEDISRSLNTVFAVEHTVSLDRLMEMSRKEVQAYLAAIDGLEAYTRARIRLLGLRQHAMPMDEAMWALAQQEQIVGARVSLDEAQQFLERQIAEEDALEVVALLKRHAWNEFGAAVKRHDVSRILSVPPDRSTRNMLQMVAAASGAMLPEELDVDLEEGVSEAEPDVVEAGVGARATAGTIREARKGSRAVPSGGSKRRAGAAKGAAARERKRPARKPAARKAAARRAKPRSRTKSA